jgi:hypothetical protein
MILGFTVPYALGNIILVTAHLGIGTSHPELCEVVVCRSARS